MHILTTESVDTLRMEISKNVRIAENDFHDLVEDLQLNLLPSNYKFPVESISLTLPDGKQNYDTENCKAIYDSLSGLNAAQATDERLWVTLCFRDFKDYTSKRWHPTTSENETASDKKVRLINTHYFAGTIRGRMRDNAISRLWWMGHIATQVDGWTIDEVLEILFFNTDYRSSLLERHSSANSVNVLTSILSITKEAYKQGKKFNRDAFREFMKQVDFIGARTLLPSLPNEELVALLRPLYNKSYERIKEEKNRNKGKKKKKKKGRKKRKHK